MTLQKIVSGGQQGVDRFALQAAHEATLQTGGWAPKGWRTLDGPDLELPKLGLLEHPSPDYPPRTEANVRDSDGTLRIARDFASAGERCTLAAIERLGKTHLDVDASQEPTPDVVDEIEAWIRTSKIRTLNVAGNTEKTAPGIGEWAAALLRRVFSRFVMQVSFSQIESYLSCQRKWWLRSVVRLPEKKGEALLIGTRFHEALERWFEGMDGDALWPAGWDEGITPVEADVIRRMLADAVVTKPRKVGGRDAPVVRRVPGQLIEQRFVLDVLPAEERVEEGGEGYRHCGICSRNVDCQETTCPRGHDLSENPVFSKGRRILHLPAVRLVGAIDVCDVAGAEVHDNKTMKTEGFALDEDGLRADKQILTYAHVLLLARAEANMPEPATIRVRHNRFIKGEGRADFCEATVTPEEVRAEWARTVETARAMREVRVLQTPRERDLDERMLPLYDPVHVHEIMPSVRPAETDRKQILSGRGKKLACAKYRGCDFREICGGLWSVEDYRTHAQAKVEGELTSAPGASILPPSSPRIDPTPTLISSASNPNTNSTLTSNMHAQQPNRSEANARFIDPDPNPNRIESGGTSMLGIFGQTKAPVVAGGVAPAAPSSSPPGVPAPAAAPPPVTPPAGAPFSPFPFAGQAPPAQPFPSAPGASPSPIPPAVAAPPPPPASPQAIQPMPPHPQGLPCADLGCIACRHETGFGGFAISSSGDACMICQGRAIQSNRPGPHNVDMQVTTATSPPQIHWQFRPEVHDKVRALGWPLSGVTPAPWLRQRGQAPVQQAAPTPQAPAPTPAQTFVANAFGAPQPWQAPPQAPQAAPTPPPTPVPPPPAPTQQAAPQAPSPTPGYTNGAPVAQGPNGVLLNFSGQPTNFGQAPAPVPPSAPVPPPATPTPAPTPPPAALAPNGAAAPAGDSAPKTRTKKGFTVLWNATVAGPANNQVVLAEVFGTLVAQLAGNPQVREFVRAAPNQQAWYEFDPARRLDALAMVAPAVIEQEKFGTKRVLVSTRGAHPDFLAFAQAIRGLADEVIQGDCS